MQHQLSTPTSPTPHRITFKATCLFICTNSFAPKACPQRAPEFVHGYVNSLPRGRRCVSNNTPRSYRTFLNCIAFWIRILQKCICILHLLNMQILQNAYAFCIRITLRIMRSASRSRGMDLETQVTATASCIRIYIANASRAVVIDWIIAKQCI